LKYSGGKNLPINPQPKTDDILILRKYYTTLKRAPGYKKRITWVEQFPASKQNLKALAVVEYIGIFPNTPSVHGNSKSSNAEYVRTSEATKNKLIEKVSATSVAPRKIYEEMILDDSLSAPRDLKQVQNAKHLEQKKKRCKVSKDSMNQNRRKNTADDIITLLNNMHDHPFIQEIIQTKGKPPAVILYLKEQIDEIKMFCSSDATHPGVLGVDRTFNLGPCYVTILCYQQNNLIRKGTQNHPIMLGPVFLHWDGLYPTYHSFFSHLRSQMDDSINGIQVGGRNLLVGSDEEKALTKAMKQSFPSSHHILCRRHIEENVKRHLRGKVGANDKQAKEVMSDIFGDNGLLAVDDEYEFALVSFELEEKYCTSMPNFVPYFKKLQATLLEYVFLPSKKHKSVPITWKNNSCESMNHILKLTCDWKVQKIPDLVEKLYRIVQLQYADIRRALYGMGNYVIAPWMSKFKLSQTNWATKSKTEKETWFLKFLKGTPKAEKAVKSTDGRLTIPKTQKTARKPGQRKRVKCARTKKC
jgi:hypothetical protein